MFKILTMTILAIDIMLIIDSLNGVEVRHQENTEQESLVANDTSKKKSKKAPPQPSGKGKKTGKKELKENAPPLPPKYVPIVEYYVQLRVPGEVLRIVKEQREEEAEEEEDVFFK